MTLTKREEALIARLEPGTRERYRHYREELTLVGIEERVIVTMRTVAVQKAKMDAGKSTQPVGWHQLGRAIDRQLRDPDTGQWDHQAINVQVYLRAARIAERAGFRQIGFDKDHKKRFLTSKTGAPFWDPYHIEYRGDYPSLAAAVRAEAPDLARLLA